MSTMNNSMGEIANTLTKVINTLTDRYKGYEKIALDSAIEMLLQSVEENIDKICVANINPKHIEQFYKAIPLDSTTDKFVAGVLLYKVEKNTTKEEISDTLSEVSDLLNKVDNLPEIRDIDDTIRRLNSNIYTGVNWTEIMYIYEYIDVYNRPYWKIRVSGIDYDLIVTDIEGSILDLSRIVPKAFFWDGYTDPAADSAMYTKKLEKLVNILHLEKKLHI